MILLAGLPDEPPIARVIAALDDLGLAYRLVDQRRQTDFGFSMEPSGLQGMVCGTLTCGDDEDIDLADVTGIYQRLHSSESFPELANLPAADPARVRFERFVSLFTIFSDLCTGRVLNRTPGMSTNNSKPFQAQLIQRCGFHVPNTMITNNPARARAFVEDLHKQDREVIYKSASAVRSIVKSVTPADVARLGELRICPVQFQERVAGTDLRVHVIGDEIFATRIKTTGVDYRYADRDEGGSTDLEPFDLSPDIAAKSIALSKALDLPFAGIDLRETPTGEWFCFEVNPSPAYSYYEANTGQPISNAVVRYLAQF